MTKYIEKENFPVGLDGTQYWSESVTISYKQAVDGLIRELQTNDDIDIESLSVAIEAIIPSVEGVRVEGDDIKFYFDNL